MSHDLPFIELGSGDGAVRVEVAAKARARCQGSWTPLGAGAVFVSRGYPVPGMPPRP